MNKQHKKLSQYLKKKGLHKEWSLSPSYATALRLLGIKLPVDSGSQRRRAIRQILKEDAGVRPARKKHIPVNQVSSDEFLLGYEWRKLRMEALKRDGAKCVCCGATSKDGVRLHVDHIKPRKKYPELALSLVNLQVLCEECNHGKGNWDETDWKLVRNENSIGRLTGPRPMDEWLTSCVRDLENTYRELYPEKFTED